MKKLKSIIPDILFFRFSSDLWHILRANGFGVTMLTGCTAVISVNERKFCTMDVLGRVNPDKTFLEESPAAFNHHLDRLIYLYLSTLYTCLNRRPMIRLCMRPVKGGAKRRGGAIVTLDWTETGCYSTLHFSLRGG